jgi:CheY-like chemotaxis protein
MSAPIETILIVDDDANDVELLRHAFQKLGNANPVHVCEDGASALDYLDGKGHYADREKFPLPFIVILDWKLLRVSGLDVLRKIRGRQEIGKLCVVVLSGSESPADREAALQAGADLFLRKAGGQFLEVVTTILQFWARCETPG